MRRWLNLLEVKLNEVSKPIRLERDPGVPQLVWRNPTRTSTLSLTEKFSLRGLCTDDVLYVWNAMEMIHSEMADLLEEWGQIDIDTYENLKEFMIARDFDADRLVAMDDGWGKPAIYNGFSYMCRVNGIEKLTSFQRLVGGEPPRFNHLANYD